MLILGAQVKVTKSLLEDLFEYPDFDDTPNEIRRLPTETAKD
jgi:hypothetical protein